MNLLKFIDRFSFKQLLSASVFLAILLSIPLGVWLVNQQTKLSSRAVLETPGTPLPTPTFGPQPNQPPVITQVKPFLGKAGDAVMIFGVNFGNNPARRRLWIGNQEVTAGQILLWENNTIQFLLPQDAASSEIRLVIEPWQVIWPRIFTLYSQTTDTQVYYRGESLAVRNIKGLKKVLIWPEKEDQSREIVFESPQNVGADGLDIGFVGKTNWVILFSQDNRPIPFFVNPAEFGF